MIIGSGISSKHLLRSIELRFHLLLEFEGILHDRRLFREKARTFRKGGRERIHGLFIGFQMVCDTSFRIGTLEGTLSLVYRTLELVSQFIRTLPFQALLIVSYRSRILPILLFKNYLTA